MDLGLKDKTAIVAASTKGLGKATAIALALEGANVVINGRHKQNLNDTVDEIKSKTGKTPLAIQGDVTQAEDIDRLFDEVVKHFGTVHILVSNAGGPPAGSFSDFNDEQWLNAVELNLMSTVRLIRKATPIMQKQKWGRIVNITSLTVKQPADNLLLSNSVRAAIIGFAKTISRDLAPHNVLINNIAPYYVATKRIDYLMEETAAKRGITKEAALKNIIKEIPMGRLGTPEEFGDFVTFLCSEKNSYVTGATIQFDGGAYRGML
ncbi:MAG: SDR family oxidoreductase [Bacteroidetes bacterium]|nr:SDR family oxidoreductase [Bacteroidota bacterium]MCL5739008.1 SDR family oxidoreductase [Bacteroidota bacterium]